MSERPDSDKQTNPSNVESARRTKRPGYFEILFGGFVATLLKFWDTKRDQAAKEEQQRADEHLIAAATDKMARYTKWLVAATVASVATAVLTLWVLHNQLSAMQSEQRPWVRVSVNPTKLILTIWKEEQFINLNYDIAVKDFGRIPARNINPAAILAIRTSDARAHELDLLQRQMCAQAEDTAKRDPIGRITIFPEDPDIVSSGSGSPWEPSYFYLVGCIDFTYGDGLHGKTAFRYILGTVKDSLFASIPFPKNSGVADQGGAVYWDIPLTSVTFKRDDIGNYVE